MFVYLFLIRYLKTKNLFLFVNCISISGILEAGLHLEKGEVGRCFGAKNKQNIWLFNPIFLFTFCLVQKLFNAALFFFGTKIDIRNWSKYKRHFFSPHPYSRASSKAFSISCIQAILFRSSQLSILRDFNVGGEGGGGLIKEKEIASIQLLWHIKLDIMIKKLVFLQVSNRIFLLHSF